MQSKFGVIGHPIGHTMSPFIQKELFSLRGFDGCYGKYDISPEQLENEMSGMLKNLNGFNVTIPHKVAILPYLDEIDSVAAEYGAVNTVKLQDGRFIGYNTDAYGFKKGLELSGIELAGRIAVYGYGGAARTIITEGVKSGCEVAVITSSERKETALSAVKHINEKVVVFTTEELDKNFDLFINASPVGMYPNSTAAPINEEQIDLFSCVYDIVYNPSETELIKIAKNRGKVWGTGMSMLVCQAQLAQTYWYGAEFSLDETKFVIQKAEQELQEVFGK